MEEAGPEPDRQRLMDEAIDLVIRLQNDPGNPIAIEMIQTWRERSTDHERIWQRVAKLHGATGILLKEQDRSRHEETQGLSRRNLIIGGAIGLAASAAYLAMPRMVLQARADYITEKAELRPLILPDGSRAVLGPDSAIAFDFNDRRRHVELLSGMSFFETRDDGANPFTVKAEALTIKTAGTAFDISNDAGQLTLTVQRGMAELHMSGSAQRNGIQLKPGDWASFDQQSREIERGIRDVGQVASWRDNLLIAEAETISALVARIGRWIPGHVILADASIGSERVSGIYDLKTPLRALEAVVHPAGAHVRQISSFLTVVSPI